MPPCHKSNRNKIIPLLDRTGGKSKMTFKNPNERRVVIVNVDGCLINEGARCDFLLYDHNNIEHYIELKGSNVPHACEQIEETINKICRNKKSIKFGFIVPTVVRPTINTTVQKFKIKFQKLYNCTLIVKSTHCIYQIE